MKILLISIVKLYQRFISPLLPRACRFYPSCSEYAIQCLQIHNTFYALFLITKRILKCNPLFEGGFDPVPLPTQKKESQNLEGNNGRTKF